VDGTLLYIGVEKGKAAPVNGIIAIVGKEGEDYKALLAAESKNAGESSSETAKQTEEKKSPQKDEKTTKNEDRPAEDKPAKEAAGSETGKKAGSGDATVVRMPLLSDTMKEGKIVAWLKQEGDKVKSDDVIAEVETDKATMEVMPYVDGTLLYIGIPEGEAAKVNQIIAIVGKEGTDISPYLDEDAAGNGGKQQTDEETTNKSDAVKTPSADQDSDQQPAQKESENTDDERIKASPLARRIAREKGISLRDISGT